MWYSPSWKFMKKTIFLGFFSFQNLEDLKISMHLLPTKNQTEKTESFDYLFYDGNQDNLATREKRVCSKVVRIVTKLLIFLLISAGSAISYYYYFNNWRYHHIGRTKRNFFCFFFWFVFSALIIFFPSFFGSRSPHPEC